jgi:hypothetical protein
VLLVLARQCLERALDDEYETTQVESRLASDSISENTSAAWNDTTGVAQRVRLLTSASNGEPRYVGVLVSTAPAARHQNHPLLAAVADYIVATGDTQGLAIDS